MGKAQRIELIIQYLHKLFEDKDRLVGYADWDVFLGCIQELANIMKELIAEEQKQTTEE